VVPPAPPDRGAWGVPWRTERRFRDLVEQVPVVVYVDGVGPDAPLEFIGSRIEGLLGYPVEDWLADPHLWRDRVHPDDRDRVGAAFDSSGRTGRSFTIEYRMVARDGRCVWVRDECALVRNPDGSPRCWQGVLRDISEERRVREEQRELLTALESERRFRDALDRVDLVAATLDASGRVRYCNRTLLRLTGWRMEEVLARSWWDTFVPEEEAGERVGFLQDVRVGNLPPRSERPILTRSKERRLVSWSSVVRRRGAVGRASRIDPRQSEGRRAIPRPL
jgi:PAS domain S-box-containing protein